MTHTPVNQRTKEGKRVPLNMRTTQSLRKKMEEAAAESGRSLVQEVEARMEESFRREEAEASEYGGYEALFRMLGGAANLIEERTGASSKVDYFTHKAVQRAWAKLIAQTTPSAPDSVKDAAHAPEPEDNVPPRPEKPLPPKPVGLLDNPEVDPEALKEYETQLGEHIESPLNETVKRDD